MTLPEIDALRPGTEADRLIAEAMGWTQIAQEQVSLPPPVSTSDVWLAPILERIVVLGAELDLIYTHDDAESRGGYWTCIAEQNAQEPSADGTSALEAAWKTLLKVWAALAQTEEKNAEVMPALPHRPARGATSLSEI